MSEQLTANPEGMKWCAEHKKWEHIRIENDLHIPVSEWHCHYKAHIAAIIKMLPGNGGDAKCCECGKGADIVTDGRHTEFYCNFHWDNIDAVGWRERAERDPLTNEEKEVFGIEEAE